MKPRRTSPRPGGVAWFYRQLLRLYPAAFRRRYEEEMLLMFASEWERAAAEGWGAQWRCAGRLLWDFFQTAPQEWTARVSQLGVLTVVVAGLSACYLAIAPLPLLLKVLGCAGLTTLFTVAVVATAGRARISQFKLAALGLPIGAALGFFLGLYPKPLPAPETPLVVVADPALTGSVIYERMRAAYVKAQTYTDEGEEQEVYSGLLRRVRTRPFETAFVRGGGFRFEFREQFNRLDDWRKYIIWTDGTAVKRWWAIQPQVEEEKDLEFALGTAAGVSGLTSTLIPNLLQPNPRSGLLTAFRSGIALLGTQRVDGHEPFRLQITRAGLPTMTVWIDRRTYLVDRISLTDPSLGGIHTGSGWIKAAFFDTWTPSDTIVYRPRLNAPINPRALTFEPGPTSARWRMFVNGDIYAMVFAGVASFLVALLNRTHRRILRKHAQKKESWLTPLTKRQWGGNIAIGAVSLGMWLSGGELSDVLQNFMLSIFALQGGFLIYVMHRRSRGYARFAGAR